jgi:thiamine biosynthesis lipoprotein
VTVLGAGPALHSRFDAFGSYGHVAVRRPRDLAPVLEHVQQVVADVDTTCSRFRDDSDLARANRRPGRWTTVDPLLVAAVEAACAAAEATGGLVHPLLGRPLVTLGYDRDFDELVRRGDDTDQVPGTAPAPTPDTLAWQAIGLDPGGRLRVPLGTALDLGATGKAWAADVAAYVIEQELGVPALVSLGGDLRIAAPDGGPWQVAVSEAPGQTPDTIVSITDGGLATSSTRVRRWTADGVERHHVVDPRTGQPAAEVWRTVTAVAPTAADANTATTASVVLGHEASGWLVARDVPARLVAANGTVVRCCGWPADAVPAPAPVPAATPEAS